MEFVQIYSINLNNITIYSIFLAFFLFFNLLFSLLDPDPQPWLFVYLINITYLFYSHLLQVFH